MKDRARLFACSPFHGAMAQSRTDPEQVTLFRSWTRLTSSSLGVFEGRPHEGFFHADTLYITQYLFTVNGRKPRHTLSAQTSPHEWCSISMVPGSIEEGNLAEGTVPRGSVEVRILRSLDGCWNESILIRNYGVHPRELLAEISLVCPIGDIQYEEEMKLEALTRFEGLTPTLNWECGRPQLFYERDFGPRRRAPTEELLRIYGDATPRDGQKVIRRLAVELETFASSGSTCDLRIDPGTLTRLALPLKLEGDGWYELRLCFRPGEESFGGARRPLTVSPPLPKRRRPMSAPQTRIMTGNSTLNLILAQAEMDLESLELPLLLGGSEDRGGPVLSAGVPRYVGLFGRDILTASWQGSLLSPRYIENALGALERLRGVRWDPWRDEQPGQIPHELRLNPLAATGETNREIYYGDVVSTPFWIVTLATAFHWTGDHELIRRHVETIGSCCDWIERRLEEGKGFVFYAPGSPAGNRHHAWKDSGDAIVDRRGHIRVSPLATAEVQGYCFLAMMAAAELFLVLGHPVRAYRLLTRALELKRRFNESFWMPDREFFAVAIDSRGESIDSVTSNIGHCLGCGIVDSHRVPAVVARLISPDMFSGWGIRTLSTVNPAFDPFSYHRGSVWPVENATIAGAFRLCGYDRHAAELIEAQLATATLFPYFRLPEVMSGHPRSSEYPIPGLYPNSNPLQAWSVSAVFFSIMILLGLRPMAQLRTLLLCPVLPEWLPWIELQGLHVGNARVDLRFWRDRRGRSRWKVLDKSGALLVIEQQPELDRETGLGRRIMTALRSAA